MPEDLTGRTFGLVRVERRLNAKERGAHTGVWWRCVCTGCGDVQHRGHQHVLDSLQRSTLFGCRGCANRRGLKVSRNEAIVRRVLAGEVYETIAADFGITRERVRQIGARVGHRRRKRYLKRGEQRAAKNDEGRDPP